MIRGTSKYLFFYFSFVFSLVVRSGFGIGLTCVMCFVSLLHVVGICVSGKEDV